jgi:hypothetical protein
VFLSFSALAIMRHRSFRVFGKDRRRRWLYLAGGLLMLFSQLSPLVGLFGVDRVCSTMACARSQSVTLALERYYQEHGVYPESIDGLVPGYLPTVPSVCGNDFYLVRCPREVTLLAVSSPNGLGARRLNLQTGRWSGIDTLDFDICDRLEEQ